MDCIKCGKQMMIVGHNKDGTDTFMCKGCRLFYVGTAELWVYNDGEVYHG